MQNAEHHQRKKEDHYMNQFNDVEYERWLGRSKRTQSAKPQWGIESFLGTTENPQAKREDISASPIEIDEK
jgi:hypothetical protein